MTKRPKQVVLKYGLSELEILLTGKTTINKLLSISQIQERLNFDRHNVRALTPDGVIVDLETFIGSKKIVLLLETATNIKGALNRRKLIRGLSESVGLKLKRHGARHDIFVTTEGVQIQIPRHPGDLSDGTLRSIIKDAMPGTRLSDFKRRIS